MSVFVVHHRGGRASNTIRARATDLAGRTQPDKPEWNPLGYANNAIHQVRVAVAAASAGARPPREMSGAGYLADDPAELGHDPVAAG
jgi:hypothetical protein